MTGEGMGPQPLLPLEAFFAAGARELAAVGGARADLSVSAADIRRTRRSWPHQLGQLARDLKDPYLRRGRYSPRELLAPLGVTGLLLLYRERPALERPLQELCGSLARLALTLAPGTADLRQGARLLEAYLRGEAPLDEVQQLGQVIQQRIRHDWALPEREMYAGVAVLDGLRVGERDAATCAREACTALLHATDFQARSQALLGELLLRHQEG